MTTEAPYGGGIGGKFRRRAPRYPPSKPYDRPPLAVRGVRGLSSSSAAAERNGWLSKLVDPTSRIITQSAYRLFSSVFRKRLLAPPSEGNHQSKQEVLELCTKLPSEEREQGGSDTVNLINTGNSVGMQHKTVSGTNGISELEQLLKQKTFTRFEYDRLTELLRARTIEPCMSKSAVTFEKKENEVKEQENGIRSIRSNGNFATPATTLTDEFASPAELAKTYMSSQPSKVSSSTLSIRNQFYREDTALPSNESYGQNQSNIPITPSIAATGISQLPENGYTSPKHLGKSAMHRMSRSPYFNPSSTTRTMGDESYTDGFAGLSTSPHWTPTNFTKYGGKQAQKRRSSVLDSDLGSSGPIRRIRQKSNLMSPWRNMSSHYGDLSCPSTPLYMNGKQGQKPLYLDAPKYGSSDLHDAENRDRISLASAVPVPPPSTEMKRKISQHPREQSSDLGGVDSDGMPLKLTVSMLHGRALKSMEDIDTSLFLNLQGTEKMDASPNSKVNLGNSISQKQDNINDKFPFKPTFSGANETFETVGTTNVVSPSGAKRSKKTTENLSCSVLVPLPEKHFKMIVPEDFFDLDDDDDDEDNIKDEKLEPMSSSETVRMEKPPLSQSGHASSSMLIKEADTKASNGPATRKDNGFAFPVTPAPISYSQPPPTPTMPSPLLDRPAQKKEEVAPPFTSGSKESDSLGMPTTITEISEPTVLNASARSAMATPLPEGSNSDKGDNNVKVGNLFAQSGHATSSGLSAPTIPSLSNSSLTSRPSASDVVVTPSSNGSALSTFTTEAATFTSPISSSISSTAPTFPAVPSFHFGSVASTGATISVSPAIEKSSSTESKASPLSTSTAIAFGTSTTFPTSAPSMTSTISNTSNGFLMFGTPAQSSSSSLSVATATNTCQDSSVTFVSTAGSNFGSQATQAGSKPSEPSQTAASQVGSFASSPAFGITGSTSSGFSSSPFVSTTFGAKPFVSSPGFQFSTTASSSASVSEAAAATSLFSSSSQPSTSSIFGSSTSSPSTGVSSSASSSQSSTPFVFGSSAPSLSTGLSFEQSAPASTSEPSKSSIFGSTTSSPFGQSAPALSSHQSKSSVFGSTTSSLSTGFQFGQSISTASAQPSKPTVFGSTLASSASTGLSFGKSDPTSSSQPSTPFVFGSSTSSPSTGFSFGHSAPASSSQQSTPSIFGSSPSPPVTFGSSSGPVFPFSSISPSPTQPVFGFGSGSPGNDQMNEDSMADDTNRVAAPVVPTFGQLAANPPSNFGFGSPAAPTGGPLGFQFGGQQNPLVHQSSPSPFQAPGNPGFPGGSFSLGSGGGSDKSGRKFVKVNRNKMRKK